MIWIFFALGAALLTAISDNLAKKILKNEDPYLVALGKMSFAAPLLIPLLFFIEIPKITPVFWKTMIIALPLEILALLLYMKGVKASPISLTIPFLAFTPVFIILTGFLILGELPSLYGAVGIVFVVLGAYVLNISNWRQGALAPIKAIFKENGSVMFLGVALVYSITSVLGRKMVLETSGMFIACVYPVAMSIALLPIVAKKTKNIKKLVKKPGLLIVLGAVLALTAVCHFTALSLVKTAYMVSVKRTSILLSTLIAYFAFKEEHMTEHLVGALVMVLGVVIITLLG